MTPERPMSLRHSTAYVVTALAALGIATAGNGVASDGTTAANRTDSQHEDSAMQTHPYVGMWVTADGHVRHELLSNGRYDEARGRTQSAYQGRYRITGHHIDYVDDTGFTADGDFIDGVLHHGGMVLYRERAAGAMRDR